MCICRMSTWIEWTLSTASISRPLRRCYSATWLRSLAFARIARRRDFTRPGIRFKPSTRSYRAIARFNIENPHRFLFAALAITSPARYKSIRETQTSGILANQHQFRIYLDLIQKQCYQVKVNHGSCFENCLRQEMHRVVDTDSAIRFVQPDDSTWRLLLRRDQPRAT